ncbi:heavy-metal-associated domain-containing protein [Maribacter sedimenticola]|nr:heavy metal-associated domain-containing protein [Maribacter sedimenticola]
MGNKLFISFFILSALSFSDISAQESTSKIVMQTTNNITHATIAIDGMACQEGCANKIGANLKEAKGVLSADISFENKNGIIVFDPTVIGLEEIEHIITNTKVKNYVYTIKSIQINKE